MFRQFQNSTLTQRLKLPSEDFDFGMANKAICVFDPKDPKGLKPWKAKYKLDLSSLCIRKSPAAHSGWKIVDYKFAYDLYTEACKERLKLFLLQEFEILGVRWSCNDFIDALMANELDTSGIQIIQCINLMKPEIKHNFYVPYNEFYDRYTAYYGDGDPEEGLKFAIITSLPSYYSDYVWNQRHSLK